MRRPIVGVTAAVAILAGSLVAAGCGPDPSDTPVSHCCSAPDGAATAPPPVVYSKSPPTTSGFLQTTMGS